MEVFHRRDRRSLVLGVGLVVKLLLVADESSLAELVRDCLLRYLLSIIRSRLCSSADCEDI